MRIRFEQSGGLAYFPALAEPVELDTADLPAEDAARVEELVHRTGILDASAPIRQDTAAAPDGREYRISIIGDDVRTAVLRDPLPGPDFAELISCLNGFRPGS